MSVIVAGSYRVPPESLPALRPHMLAVIESTRAEAGCLDYAYAEDVAEAGLIRVFELWTDQPALDAHFQSPHMRAWQEARAGYGFYDRDISVYEIAGRRKL